MPFAVRLAIVLIALPLVFISNRKASHLPPPSRDRRWYFAHSISRTLATAMSYLLALAVLGASSLDAAIIMAAVALLMPWLQWAKMAQQSTWATHMQRKWLLRMRRIARDDPERAKQEGITGRYGLLRQAEAQRIGAYTLSAVPYDEVAPQGRPAVGAGEDAEERAFPPATTK